MKLQENPVLVREFRIRCRKPKFLFLPVLSVIIAGLLWHLSFNVLAHAYQNTIGHGGQSAHVLGSAFPVRLVFLGGLVIYFSSLFSIVMPALLATTIARERENRTFEAVLLTPLRPKDIFIGKLVSVSSPIWLSIVCVLPFIALASDHSQIGLSGFQQCLLAAATLAGGIAIALISLSISVFIHRVAGAVVTAYAVIFFGLPIVNQIIIGTLARMYQGSPITQLAQGNAPASQAAVSQLASATFKLIMVSYIITNLTDLILAALLAYAAVRSLDNPVNI